MSYDIEELEREIYEDLNGRITDVAPFERNLTIRFECDHWKSDTRVKAELKCAEVVESTITVGTLVYELSRIQEHPILWEYNQPHADVYFTSAPQNEFELLGPLYERARELFAAVRLGSTEIFASSKSLRQGYGLLARGPTTVANEIYDIATQFVASSLVQTRPAGGEYLLLDFGDNYVVCREVRLARAS